MEDSSFPSVLFVVGSFVLVKGEITSRRELTGRQNRSSVTNMAGTAAMEYMASAYQTLPSPKQRFDVR